MLVERELAIRALRARGLPARCSPPSRPTGAAAGRPTRAPGSGRPRRPRRSAIKTAPDAAAGRMARRPCGSSSARAHRAGGASSRSAPRRSGCRRRSSTTSPSCSATPTASTASARRRPSELAQALYEQHKLLSYPRTDSRHLSHATSPQTLAAIVARDRGPYREQLAPGTGERPSAGASSTTRRSPTTTPSSPPRPARGVLDLADGRAQDLRPRLPPPPLRLARRPRLVGDHA